ncbi:class I glutamine amidotransferase-like protein [Rhizodiscina lignyota]|uniref:Class I glutamine amidotransferase-like protein n=1 Tax=Rhizodiscina lignyota TaxID=1504668 RepID=A0A9P4IIZ9_9PEZI|nr:class I glutamine amidotransferase-like protein [Rhizodiscina lignyota]
MLVFRGFEPMDVFGPIEALLTLSRYYKMNIALLSETMDPVDTRPPTAAGNPLNSNVFQQVLPTHTLKTAPKDLEVLIIPGEAGSRSPLLNDTIAYIAETYPKLKYLITVCTGSLLAAKAGVLDGKHATTNKAAWYSIVKQRPQVNWVSHARWTVDGNIWTSSGISAGIDITLAFIECQFGNMTATKVANFMEYERHTNAEWDPFAAIFNVTGV